MPRKSKPGKGGRREGEHSATQLLNMSSPPSSPPSKPQNEVVVIDLCHSASPPPQSELLNGTPLRPIFCVKNREAMKEVENREDCFILDFDPDDPPSFSSSVPSKNLINLNDDGTASPDIRVVAEKGQVACRDYPHSRHLCLKYPFANTPHESFCELCYCFVCDRAAPCARWSKGGSVGHCHAMGDEAWKVERKLQRKLGSC